MAYLVSTNLVYTGDNQHPTWAVTLVFSTEFNYSGASSEALATVSGATFFKDIYAEDTTQTDAYTLVWNFLLPDTPITLTFGPALATDLTFSSSSYVGGTTYSIPFVNPLFPPALASAAVDATGTAVAVNIGSSAPLLPASGSVTGYTLYVNGTSVSISATVTGEQQHTLTLSSTVILATDTVTVAYSSGNVTDSSESLIPMTEWSATAATNNSILRHAAITNVTSTTANGLKTLGDAISIQLLYDYAVTVTGAPLLALNSGGTAIYTGGSGTTTLTFSCTVGYADATSRLDYVATNSLTLHGGTINTSVGGLSASLMLPVPGAIYSLGYNTNIAISGQQAPTGTVPTVASAGQRSARKTDWSGEGDVYPHDDLDRPDKVIRLLGSYWADTYQGDAQVISLLSSRLAVESQTMVQLQELVDACGDQAISPRRRVAWRRIVLLASQRNVGQQTRKFGDGGTFGEGLLFGAVNVVASFAWAIPVEVLSAAVVSDSPTGSHILSQGCDYRIADGYIWFRKDPFTLFTSQSLLVDGQEAEQELELWLGDVQEEHYDVYRQFGYVLGMPQAGGAVYKRAVNAVWDALARGSSLQALQDFLVAMTDVPVAGGTETVEEIVETGDQLLIITNETVYAFSLNAVPLVKVGDVVQAGQALTNALAIYQAQQLPSSALPAISVGVKRLAPGFHGPLMFLSRETPLVVTTVDELTKVEFEIGGWPTDITLFFDMLHARGISTGKTLAQYLDERPEAARTTEPTADALPETLNPMRFLCDNVLRNNTIIAVIHPVGFGPDALGLGLASLLRQIIPPGIMLLLCIQLEMPTDQIRMDAAGDATALGYDETVASFVGELFTESVSTDYIAEAVRVAVVGQRCGD